MTFKVVAKYPGYLVSEDGEVLGKRGRPKTQYRDRDGYLKVSLVNSYGIQTTVGVHRLVALAFIGDPPDGKNETCHIDGTRDNNCVGNLRWGSRQENSDDRTAHGRVPKMEGHAMAKINMAIAERIREEVAKGRRHREVATEFGVSKALVSLIRCGKLWATEGTPLRSLQMKGENHGCAKLTQVQVDDIRERLATGLAPSRIANDFGVSKSLIYLIAKNKLWRKTA